jgi:Dolichyl-phosphate-mannose-protein mannosyltransferase
VLKGCGRRADDRRVEIADVRTARSERRAAAVVPGVRLRLAALVGVSFVLRAVVAGASATPRYFPDEYLYAALGRSLGTTGTPTIRGGSVHLTQLIEPLLAAPIWALTSVGTAYRLVQLENALFMSLAAIPVYLLARKLDLSERYALLCAAFSVATPDLVLSRYVMTDPIAYPLVLASVYVAVVALDRPSRRAELAFVGLGALSVATRVQYVALFLAFGAASLVLERRRVLRVYPRLGLLVGIATVAILGLGASRVAGYYAGVLHMHFSLSTVRWAALDVFLLALASGVVLAPGAIAALLRPRGRAEIAFSLFTLTFGAVLVVQAALMASNASYRFEERYLFTLLPLVPVAFGLYARRSRSARVPLLLVSAGLLVALAKVPLSGYAIGTGNNDSPFLYAVSELQYRLGLSTASLVVALAGSTAVILGVVPQLRRRAGALAAVALVLVSLASLGATAYDKAYGDAVRAEYVAPNPSWIDALGFKRVSAIATPEAPPRDLLDQLFWNRSLTRELLLRGANRSDAAPASPVSIGHDGTLRTANGLLRAPLLWEGFAESATFDGAVLAAQQRTFDLWRPTATPRLRVLETGRYWDGWLARKGKVTVWPDASGLTRGVLAFTLSLPRSGRPVQVRIGGRRLQISPGQRLHLRFRIAGRGPQSLSFTATGSRVARDLRPLSVRSTMPVFVRSRA